MAQFSETVDIKRPPEEVWRVLGQPERWFEGYLETRSRSPEYPAPDTRNDHLYRTRMREEVEVRVTRSEAPTLLEETQQGRTFARRVRYSLSPAPDGTLLRVEDTSCSRASASSPRRSPRATSGTAGRPRSSG